MRPGTAEQELVVESDAKNTGNSSNQAKCAFYDTTRPASCPPATPRGDGDTATQCMGAIQGWSRAPDKLDPVGIDDHHVSIESRRIILNARRVGKAHAVYQKSGFFFQAEDGIRDA